MILVQKLETHWTKESRGGPEAGLRNKTPSSLKIPPHSLPLKENFQILCHEVNFNEANDFEPSDLKLATDDLMPSNLYKCKALTVRLGKNNSLKLQFVWTMGMGAPSREDRNLGSLTKGQWIRLEYNGRYGERNSWTYHKTIINIGFFDKWSDDVFTKSPPHQTYKEMAKLL